MTFSKLTRYVDSLESFSPARELIIYRNHEIIYKYITGYSDPNRVKPLTGKEIYLIYSSTKVATCVGALRLVERGLLNLEEKVSKYLPEYEYIKVKDGEVIRPAKTDLLVKHLFLMCGGLSYNLNSEILKPFKEDKTATTRDVIRALSKEPLLFDPGVGFEYSFCHDVLGAVIEVASGKSFAQYMQDEIFLPLGMHDTVFHLNEEQKSRLVTHWLYNHETGKLSVGDGLNTEFHLSPKYESGGAGIYTTAADYSKFADAIACGGTGYNGYEVLKPETVEMLSKNWLNEVQLKDFEDKLDHIGHGYGLGCMVLMDKNPRHWKCPEGIFGWSGAAGTKIVMDTKNKLSFYYSQEVIGGPSFTYEEHFHNVIINMIYELLNI